MAKYDLNGNEKDFKDGNLSDQQKMIIKKEYLGYNSKSKNRDEIAKQLHLKKDRVQPFFKYLSNNSEYKELHKKNFPARVRNKEYDIKYINKDYAKGMTIQQLQKKYHTSTEKMESIVKQSPAIDKEKHIVKLRSKRSGKGNYDSFYKRIIKHRNADIVCRLKLINKVHIQKYPDKRNSAEHSTNFLTFNIKGKGDVENLLDSIEKNTGNILYENGTILCKDYRSNTIVPLSVIIGLIN